MKVTLITILFFLPFALSAQTKYTLSGTVKDATSGEDLIGVTVLVKTLGTGTVTNVYGFYSLTLPAGEYEVTYSYVGFATFSRKVELTADLRLPVSLQPNMEMLEGVTITDVQENDNITSAEVGMVRLEPKTLQQLPSATGEVDVLKSLQLLPGISSTSESSSGFNVRGGAADQNLILLDEAVVYNSSHLFGLFSVFNPEAVKSLEMYKGGIPARYGGRLSSVLDVRQKEGNNKQYGGVAEVGLISSKLMFEGPIVKERGSFLIAGRRSYADLFLAIANIKNSAYFYDLNLKANYKLGENDRVYLSGYFGRDNFEIGSTLTNIWGNTTGTLRWNHFFGPKLFSNFSMIYSQYDYTLDEFASGASLRRKSDIQNINGKADFTYFLNSNNKIEAGLNVKSYAFNPGDIAPLEGSGVEAESLDQKNARELGFYLSNEQKLGSKLTAIYGLRMSNFSRVGKQTIAQYENDAPVVYNPMVGLYEDGTIVGERAYTTGEAMKTFLNWEPRLALSYVVNDKNAVKASYNRTYQYLHLVSNNTSITPLDIWAPSGPFFKPQEADQISLGYFRNFKDNTYQASVEVFGKQMRNVLDYVPGADLLFNNTLETEVLSGEGRAYGLELYAKKSKGRLTGWVSYTLARTERKIDGLTANDPGINNGDWYASNYDKTHDLSITSLFNLNERWTLSANFVYATGLPTTYPSSGYTYLGLIVPQYETRNQHRITDYHRLDLGANLKSRKKENSRTSHVWAFGIYNVYNRQNASAINFREDSDNLGQVNAIKTSIFGIVPNVSYKLNF